METLLYNMRYPVINYIVKKKVVFRALLVCLDFEVGCVDTAESNTPFLIKLMRLYLISRLTWVGQAARQN